MPEKLFINAVNLRVIAKAEDNHEKLVNDLVSMVPFDIKTEKIACIKKTDQCLNLASIAVYEIELLKKRHLRAFQNFFFDNLSTEQIELLSNQMDSRLDDRCFFFIRLDKTKFQDGEYQITDSGDCYHIRLSIAAYPAKRAVGKAILGEMLLHFLAKKKKLT